MQRYEEIFASQLGGIPVYYSFIRSFLLINSFKNQKQPNNSVNLKKKLPNTVFYLPDLQVEYLFSFNSFENDRIYNFCYLIWQIKAEEK